MLCGRRIVGVELKEMEIKTTNIFWFVCDLVGQVRTNQVPGQSKITGNVAYSCLQTSHHDMYRDWSYEQSGHLKTERGVQVASKI